MRIAAFKTAFADTPKLQKMIKAYWAKVGGAPKKGVRSKSGPPKFSVTQYTESNFLLQPRHMQKPLEVLAFFALEPVAEVLTLGSDDGDPTLLLGEPLGRPSFFFSPSRPPSRPSPPPPPPSKATQRSSAPSPSSDAVRHGAAGASPSSANMAGVPGNKKCL